MNEGYQVRRVRTSEIEGAVIEAMEHSIRTLMEQALEQDTQIRKANAALRALVDMVPFPAWCKVWRGPDVEPVMAYINPAYVERFGVSLEAYVGKTDRQVWGDVTGGEYFANDKEAYVAAPKGIYTLERIPDKADPMGGNEEGAPFWRVLKKFVLVEPQEYVVGYAMRIDEVERSMKILEEKGKYVA